MDYQSGHVVNLANSIIGVSILAMPYCFKQCGIILSITILLISSIISRLSCHFLLKSAILARRKTFELLALDIFGPLGKFSIEIGIIGFLLGTCIALFVVMGDLMPDIISDMSGTNVTGTLRNGVLISLALFCVLPLGLLRNVSSLNGVSKATVAFYCCLVMKIVIEALPHLLRGDWFNQVIFWRPQGILQCLPIFSMALFCQTQLFEIYQDIPNASLEKMNNLIRVAVNICTWVYIFVGTFGYIAFCQTTFTGNILLSFKPSPLSNLMKFCFVLSLAFSFPLVIFPCRASLYSLIYKEPFYSSFHEGTSVNYIPETKFKMLTLLIVIVSLIIAILIPTIETVLGLIGSTIGVMICVLFPVTCFICKSQRNTNERILAQIMLFIGVIVMVLGTYANLYAFEEIIEVKTSNMENLDPILIKSPVQSLNIIESKLPTIDMPIAEKTFKKEEVFDKVGQTLEKIIVEKKVEVEKKPKLEAVLAEAHGEILVKDKQEPVIEPVFPEDDQDKNNIPKVIEKQNPVDEPIVSKEIQKKAEIVVTDPPKLDKEPNRIEMLDEKTKNIPESPKNNENKKNEDLDIRAIKKEENELKEQEEEKNKDTQQILIDQLQKQNQVQQELVKQHQKMIEVIEKQTVDKNKKEIDLKVNEEKLKAVKQIETIAKKAIEKISEQKEKINISNIQEEVVKEVVDIENRQLKLENKTKQMMEESKPKQQTNANLVPIPLILAKSNNNINDNTLNNNNNKIETSLNDKNIIDEKKSNLNKTPEKAKDGEEVKVTEAPSVNVRRDILSEKIREKRDLTNKFCKEIEKSTTEKPIIKMLCQLSVPHFEFKADSIEKQIKNNVDVDLSKTATD